LHSDQVAVRLHLVAQQEEERWVRQVALPVLLDDTVGLLVHLCAEDLFGAPGLACWYRDAGVLEAAELGSEVVLVSQAVQVGMREICYCSDQSKGCYELTIKYFDAELAKLRRLSRDLDRALHAILPSMSNTRLRRNELPRPSLRHPD
jgi:hypothetical protein